MGGSEGHNADHNHKLKPRTQSAGSLRDGSDRQQGLSAMLSAQAQLSCPLILCWAPQPKRAGHCSGHCLGTSCNLHPVWEAGLSPCDLEKVTDYGVGRHLGSGWPPSQQHTHILLL